MPYLFCCLLYAGMQHPSPTHMVNNPPPPLMHPTQQPPPPPRPSFPPPQFVPGTVVNYAQPPGPHFQIGGPVAIQHYPAVSVSVSVEVCLLVHET